MDLVSAVRVVFGVAVVTSVLAIGLRTCEGDLRYVTRHHASLLVRSLIAMTLVAPVVAFLLWKSLPIGPAAAIAILCASLAPPLPLMPRNAAKAGGNRAYATSVLFTSSLLGVVTIPIGLEVLSRTGHVELATTVPIRDIVKMVAVSVLIPLLLGTGIRGLAPSFAARIVGPIERLGDALLPGLIVVVLLVGTDAIVHLTWPALAAMALAPMLGLVVGHFLGGPSTADRTVLALANATRSPALAGLVASTCFPEVRAVPAVLASVVLAVAVAALYSRRASRERLRPGMLPRESTAEAPALDVMPEPAR